MSRLPSLAVFLGAFFALSSGPARAATVTDVPDALEPDNPIDVRTELKFDLARRTALITRENTQVPADDPTGAPRTVDVKELEYDRLKFRLRPRLEVGFFKDASFFVEWPIVLWDQQTTRFATGTNTDNSTLARDMAPGPSPTVDGWPETEGTGNTRQEIVDGKYGFPGKRYNDWRVGNNGAFKGYRQGLDNPTFGLRFSPINNERDDTLPTVTVQTDYTAPFFGFMDPTNDSIDDPTQPGGVSDGLHKFHFSVAMSKRFSVLDPYFVADYTLPLPGTADTDLPGHQPRQSGGFTMGLEIVPYEETQMQQRFAVRVATSARYFSEGRDYSEVSDVFKEMTYTDQWVRIGGELGLSFKAFNLVHFDLSGFGGYDTEHYLTIEDFGKDLPDDPNAQIDLDNAAERNPFFNPALDTVGRRLRIEQSTEIGVLVHLGLNF